MKRPGICAVIVDNDLDAVKKVEQFVDLFELRIDLIGDGWQELVEHLRRPWIACNRIANEGGKWGGDEKERIEKLIEAAELGAYIVDIELATGNLSEAMQRINRKAKCLLSFHEMEKTPSIEELVEIVQRQEQAGADICKVVTTAQGVEDNLTVLQLIAHFPGTRIISFAMGSPGLLSRVLCPLVGGEFTYASIGKGRESAPGQITAEVLRELYELIEDGE